MEGDIPLLNAVDIEILTQRNAHFGGSFDVMIDYYERDGVGAMPDFSLSRLKELSAIEKQQGHDIYADFVPALEQELVEKSKAVYLDLRKVYGTQKPNAISTLVSDLILSEEEHPKGEIEALVRKGDDAISPLIDLLRSNMFYHPLFPGYGRSPVFAAKALAKIGNPKAVPALFEAMGQENFFTDDAMIAALTQFGDRAKEFLLKILQKKPYNKDNEHAIIVLTAMDDDPTVAHISLEMLRDESPFFAQYLVFACAGLKTKEDREQFKMLRENSQYPNYIKQEMDIVIKNWH